MDEMFLRNTEIQTKCFKNYFFDIRMRDTLVAEINTVEVCVSHATSLHFFSHYIKKWECKDVACGKYTSIAFISASKMSFIHTSQSVMYLVKEVHDWSLYSRKTEDYKYGCWFSFRPSPLLYHASVFLKWVNEDQFWKDVVLKIIVIHRIMFIPWNPQEKFLLFLILERPVVLLSNCFVCNFRAGNSCICSF